jgi:hypothetical protein
MYRADRFVGRREFTMKRILFTCAALAAFVTSASAAASVDAWPPSKSDPEALKKLQSLPPTQLSCEHHGPSVLVEDAYGNDLEIPSREGETCCDYEGSNLCCTNWADGGAPTCNTPPSGSDITFSSKDDVTVVEGHGFEAIAEEDSLSWCYEGKDGTVCDGTETKWGCQYFGEEGPDDIAVCILTTLAENCCDCLSVCPGEDDGGQGVDPVLLMETIAAVVTPTADLPSCRWQGSHNNNECNLVCGMTFKATCIRTATGEVGCSAGDSPGVVGKGTLPCEVPV